MATGHFVAYYRVSTDRQGQSGLGLEAQQKAVMDYLNGGSWDLVAEFTEIESGKRNDRPELEAALAACKKHKATLVVAKLDRLSRNAAFLLRLRDSAVTFKAVDMPEADRFTVGIMALVAEREAEMTSKRTREALAAAKARGTKLGWSIPSRRHEQREASRRGVESAVAHANQFAENTLPIIREIQDAGVTTLKGIAEALNARGIRTARNKRWFPATVKNVLARQTREADAAYDADMFQQRGKRRTRPRQ